MLAAHEHVCPDIADRRRTGADRHPGDRGSALARIADRRWGARPVDPGRDHPFLAGLEAGGCVATFILVLQTINTLVLVGLLVMTVLLWLALKAARKEM